VKTVFSVPGRLKKKGGGGGGADGWGEWRGGAGGGGLRLTNRKSAGPPSNAEDFSKVTYKPAEVNGGAVFR